MQAHRHHSRGIEPRRGTVLVLVLVVVVLLSLAAYRFSEGMITEQQAIRSTNRSLQLRAAADSGMEAAAAFLEDREARQLEPIIGNTLRFQGVSIAEQDGQHTRFTVLNAPSTRDGRGHFPMERIGLANESARLNLNALPLEPLRRREARQSLMALPQMTLPIADAILDWMDPDDEASEFGAESAYYLSQSPPRWPRQSRLESVEELLAIRGVTEELLFGRRSQSPRLALSSQRGAPSRASVPSLVTAPIPGYEGWARYLTITSGEGNRRQNGSPKLNVNGPDLVQLYDALRLEFDEETARFVVGWRLAGSADGGEVPVGEPDINDQSEEARKARIEAARNRAEEQAGGTEPTEPSTPSEATATAKRGGLDLSRPAPFVAKSLFDLVGTTVRIDIDQKETILKSPWSGGPAEIARYWGDLSDRLSLSDDDVVVGRININEAPLTVLLAVSGMTEPLADAVIRRRRSLVGTSEFSRRQQTLAWLLEERLVDMKQLRKMAPFLTTGGDVFRGTAIGHADGTQSAISINFVIDATRSPAVVLELRD